ncbi:hypothetical protein EDD17DRAFT_1470620 [Pisolithus thermaeus]|nr:hypothetical protein EDD17DRAFT_1470620 [Pisolithus thermaeus]
MYVCAATDYSPGLIAVQLYRFSPHSNDANRQSGFGAVGLGFLNGSIDDDEDDASPAQRHPPAMTAAIPRQPASLPLAAPRPGYPAPIAALKMPPSTSPESSRHPQMSQLPQVSTVTRRQADMGAPRMPPPIYQTPAFPRPIVPSTPHPLQPPMTPITPVFVRPSKSPAPQTDIKFASDVIIRGNSEDNLLPKRGERGDHFWRRFSMVAKEEKKPSSWLAKTQSGMSRMSRWVWLVAFLILVGIGLIVAYEISHKSSTTQQPTAVGGKANETASPTSTSAPAAVQSTSLHVSPTYTLVRRAAEPQPTVLDTVYARYPLSGSPLDGLVQAKAPRRAKKHRRQPLYH